MNRLFDGLFSFRLFRMGLFRMVPQCSFRSTHTLVARASTKSLGVMIALWAVWCVCVALILEVIAVRRCAVSGHFKNRLRTMKNCSKYTIEEIEIGLYILTANPIQCY